MSVNPPEGTLTIENSHLDVKGNVSAVALKLGTLRLTPSYGLDAVANVSNSTTHTLELSNATTGLVTTSNVVVGGGLEVGGDVQIRGTTFIKANSNSNNIAIGTEAGETTQGTRSIAVGYQAGQTTQGTQAVAVGYLAGETSQHDNSIVLNASGSALDTTGASRTYIKPLQAGVVAGNMMAYDSTSGEVINYTGVSVNASGNMDVSGDLTAGCPVYFSVKKDTDSDFGSDTTLVFPDIRINKGSGYNSSDGIFTAPIAGRYFFIFTASTRNDSDNNIVKFRKNGGFSHANNRSDSDSNDVDSMGLHDIINLDVDDTVNVSFEGHLSRAPTYFSGFYLSS